MRDALTLLEQYSINNHLSLEYLQNSLGVIGEDFLQEILHHISQKNHEKIAENIGTLLSTNIRAENFFDQMLYLLRDKMRENFRNENFSKYSAISSVFRSAYRSLRAIDDDLLIEMTILDATNYREITGATEKIIIEKIVPKTPITENVI